MEKTLRRTALYDEHIALGGRMVPFAGWELPVQYGAGPIAEHQAVRVAAGLFDIDHMGQVAISGPEAELFLNRVLSIDVRSTPVWGAHYALLPYADGGVVDDVFLYRLPEAWWLVVNAANREKDLRWLLAHAVAHDVLVEDISDAVFMLALQGPNAQRILQSLTVADLGNLAYHTALRADVAGIHTLIGATGYTGEYGYELYFPAESAVAMWRALLEGGQPLGLIPAGLAARDSLRVEAGLPLYGHELSPGIDPFSARLGVFVDFNKSDFVGRDALLKIKLEGPSRRLIGFEMLDPAVPREGYPVLVGGETVGHVSSGLKSPTTGKFIGMAFVPAATAAAGMEIAIVVRGAAKRAVVVKLPFYVPAYRR